MKLYNLEYDVKNLVIRNLSLPLDGDEEKHVNEVLNLSTTLKLKKWTLMKMFLPLAVARKVNSQNRLGSVLACPKKEWKMN